jgi:hypothetical protein
MTASDRASLGQTSASAPSNAIIWQVLLMVLLAATSGGNYFGTGLRNDALDRDIRSRKRVHHLALSQAGSVILEGDEVVRFIMAETAQAVGIGEFSQVG